MITINGLPVPSPSVLQISAKPVSGQRDYNALGDLVRDNMGTKHVVDMSFMHLSGDEAQSLFADDTDRICQATAFAQAEGAWNGEENGYTGAGCYWWLRDPIIDGYDYTYVTPFGEIYTGTGGFDTRVAVRPALWVRAA